MSEQTRTFPEIYSVWMRIRNKMNIMEEQPGDFGIGEPLHLSEIHTIQAIGSRNPNNVRIIADELGITPSAASQVISRLTRRGLVRKIRGLRNEKEVALELTERGRVAFDCHERVHTGVFLRIADRIGPLSDAELAVMARVFGAIESVYDERIAERSASPASGNGKCQP